MKNLDFKMRERFHRREQDEDRQLEREWKQFEKMKAAYYAANKDCLEDKSREYEEAYKRLKALAERGGTNASNS